MAHPSTLYAAPVAVGDKDGTTLANAAAIDPGDANDIWAILNADTPAVANTDVLLCADVPVTTTAKIEITRDGATGGTFIVQGRNAANTANAQVVLDANGGAFPVCQLTAADYWWFGNITAQNTNKASGNHAWELTANADYVMLYNCKGLAAYYGLYAPSTATYLRVGRSVFSNNAKIGVSYSTYAGAFAECVFAANSEEGLYTLGAAVGCVASGNGKDGFGGANVLHGCTAYGNTQDGFKPVNCAMLLNCIAVGNGGYGCEASTTGPTTLVNFAHYLNTSGAATGLREEFNTIALAADPFVNAAGFALNAKPTGGMLCRGLATLLPDGLSTGYADLGAVQHGDLESGGLYYHGPIAAPLGR